LPYTYAAIENAGVAYEIIIVVRNAEKVIQGLFNSIRNFKTNEVEFVVLGGLSEDNTVELIKKNEDIIDTWQSEPDKGI
jgi:glycosyltransferase involved in cell wall biosynthesis